MNYGHPLEFGTFITPDGKDAKRTVALARLSEDLGYNLVTFQDHPYRSDYLDTWTLMSWIAGATDQIRIAANVLNLPLRDPAVLARSAASLDLLSQGRLEMALGAGSYWAAIESMGGTRLSPGEAVEALSEGLDVIRALWAVGDRQSVRYNGEHYQLAGAQPGPVSAHDIPIWIGARKPRMLRLIGQKGDGWLPSLGSMRPGDLAAGNAIIDRSAIEAGRDPREIRRLVNIGGAFGSSRTGFLKGTSQDWVDDLLPLVTEDGVSTFILSSDDGEMLEQFATEVAPRLREAAEAAIPGGFLARPVKRLAVREKRREGIDYDNIPQSLVNTVTEPGDTGYAYVRSTYMRGGSPGIVFQVENTDQVVDALAYARQHPDVPFSVRSGGHGISGRSTNNGGIVLDLGKMNDMTVLDVSSRRVRIEPGARWMNVASFLAPYGWALTSGDFGGVGVGGLSTAGGIGFMARKHGLTIDHIKAVEMVLADGSIVRASEDINSDLFWAVRGAGANFGIVVAFEFEVDVVGNVAWAQFMYDASNTADFLEKWGAAIEASPRDVSGEIIMGAPQPGQPMIAQAMLMVDSDDPDTIIEQLQPIANVAPLYDQQIVITTYESVIRNAPETPHQGRGEPTSHNGHVEHITPAFAEAAADLLHSGATYFFQIRTVGGAVSDVAEDATPYSGRSANFNVAAMGASPRRIDGHWARLRPHFSGLYLSFETDLDRVHEAFTGEKLDRLREIKRKYDPDNFFRDNFNIAPVSAGK